MIRPRSRMKVTFFFILLTMPGLSGADDGISNKQYLCEDVKKPFFSLKSLPGGRSAAVPGRRRVVDFSFSVPKEKGTFRVFVAGESAASILGGGSSAELVLGDSLSRRGVEVVNCGMGAYESRRILAVLEEALGYEPDLLVVLSGNNEHVRTITCPGAVPRLQRRLSSLNRKMASLSVTEAEAAAAVSISEHEDRLRAMARAARARKVPIVFCTLPANLRDHAPAGPLPDPVRPGVGLLYSKRYAEALAEFDAPELGKDPFAHFYAGRALEALGRGPEAVSRYGAAVHFDPAMDRSSPARNAMIRRVAEGEGACLADLDRAFSGIARGGITGGEELVDGVHWLDQYNPFVYAVIGEAAARCFFPATGPSRNPAEYAAEARGSKGGRDRFRLVFSYAAAYSAGPAGDGSGRRPPDERSITALERLYSSNRDRLMKTLSSAKAAGAETLESDWDMGLKSAAESWYPTMLAAAAEAVKRAGGGRDAAELRLRLRRAAGDKPAVAERRAGAKEAGGTISPGERPAGEAEAKRLSDLAVEKIRSGDLAGARSLLEKAARAYPDGLESRLNACHLAALARDVSFGEEHCSEAVSLASFPPVHAFERDWNLPSALSARAAFLFATGQRADACADLRLALEKAPSAWGGASAARVKIAEGCR